MSCFVAYVYNGREMEIEREREREKERERDREMERESERPNTTLHLDGESLTKRQKSGKQIYPTIFPFVDSCPVSFGFSRESPAKDMWCFVAYVYNGGLVSLIGNQRVGIFPPKSEILFVLSLALI